MIPHRDVLSNCLQNQWHVVQDQLDIVNNDLTFLRRGSYMTKKLTTVKQAILTLTLISLFCTKIIFTFKHLLKMEITPLPVLFLGTGIIFLTGVGLEGWAVSKKEKLPELDKNRARTAMGEKSSRYPGRIFDDLKKTCTRYCPPMKILHNLQVTKIACPNCLTAPTPTPPTTIPNHDGLFA